MIYGVGGNPSDRVRGNRPSFEDRALSWKERGYETDFMTGIAWGSYQDYFIGLWDGEPHLDEGQVQANGDTIWHGRMVPYIVPTENYLKYFKERHVKRVIDAGIDDLYFEEPEFWNRAGYSEAFKREWKAYYNTDWRPQHESPEATYLSNKLKYFLYYRALDEVSRYAKEYGRTKGMEVRCYVPTHSLLNYSQWNIVSPEASLASLPGIDGYIAQVWTGTARTANIFNGKRKERTFETAFLEYGCVASMTEPTGRRVWFLTDPIEDWPRDWEDYRRNYHATFAAQLLYPNIADYEIMPWPERIYEGLYRKSADSEERIRIPKDYSTMMHVMINTLHEMPVTDQRLNGSQGIGIVMANSLMFQSLPTHDGYEDPQFSNFFGQAMPLLKNGIPVKIVHLENVDYKKTLADIRVLLLSYSNMKPMDPKAHKRLADWVKKGKIKVLNPDVNESNARFTVNKEGNIRFGLGGIKGFGSNVVDEIVAERESGGPFTDLFDFVERMNGRVNRKSLEILVGCGAFDSFGIQRSQFFLPCGNGELFIDELSNYAVAFSKSNEDFEFSLFGGMEEMKPVRPVLPAMRGEENVLELLQKEKELVGMYLSSHPLDRYQFEMECFANCEVAQLQTLVSECENRQQRKKVCIAGIITETKNLLTKTGKPFSKTTLEDYSGTYELALFGSDHQTFMGFLQPHAAVFIEGEIDQKWRLRPEEVRQGKKPSYGFRVKNMTLLGNVSETLLKGFSISLTTPMLTADFRKKLVALVKANAGNIPLKMFLYDPQTKYSIEFRSTKFQVAVTTDFVDALKAIGVTSAPILK